LIRLTPASQPHTDTPPTGKARPQSGTVFTRPAERSSATIALFASSHLSCVALYPCGGQPQSCAGTASDRFRPLAAPAIAANVFQKPSHRPRLPAVQFGSVEGSAGHRATIWSLALLRSGQGLSPDDPAWSRICKTPGKNNVARQGVAGLGSGSVSGLQAPGIAHSRLENLATSRLLITDRASGRLAAEVCQPSVFSRFGASTAFTS